MNAVSAAPQAPAAARSTFVTAVAWVFIVLAGFGTLITILQNVMITFMMSSDAWKSGPEQALQDPKVPWIAAFLFSHVRWLFLMAFLVAASMLASAVGLLHRKEWARIVFIVILAIGILWNVGGLAFMAMAFGGFPAIPAPPAGKGPMPDFDAMFKFMMAVNVVMVLAFSALFGWIIKRLVSPDIRREFRAGHPKASPE